MPGVREVMNGFKSYQDSDFFLCPTLVLHCIFFTYIYRAAISPSLFYHKENPSDMRCLELSGVPR